MTFKINDMAAIDLRLKEMEEENELLILQLHQVQEELEQYFLRNQELEKGRPAGAQKGIAEGKGWVDDELPDVLAEKLRLQALVEVQQKVYLLESQNALSVKLGNMLIEGVDSPSSLLSLPGKLVKTWRESSRQAPPDTLGGKDFNKVIAAYHEGSFAAVEKLMAGLSISAAMQANAYTALARQLMESDRANATEAARRAYALDPKPYRLKWLAFRLHEAGDVIEAEAMLEILPPDTPFSDSEARQAKQLRYEAKLARQRDALQRTGFAERRAAVEKQLSSLTRERDEQSRRAMERGREIDALKQAKAQLEQEKSILVTARDTLERRAQEKEKVLAESLAKADQRFHEKDKESQLLLAQLYQVQEELEQLFNKQAGLQQAKAQLDQEKLALAGQYAEQATLAEERGREVEALKQAKAQLEQEKSMLAGQYAEQAKLAEGRGREVEALKQAMAQLEQEKSAMAQQRAAQEKLAADRLKQVSDLQGQIQKNQLKEIESSNRQQLMKEELAWAEAQLELIKEMFLSDRASYDVGQ